MSSESITERAVGTANAPKPASNKRRNRKQHQKNRAEAYREIKGTEYADARTKLKMEGLGVGPNGIRSKLFAGVTDAAGAVGHLGTISTHQPIPLPITSRGVGFAASAFCKALSNYRGFEMPSINAVYRSFLGIFEAKMRRAKTRFPAVNPLYQDCEEFLLSPDWIEVMNTATIAPEPLFSILTSLGILKHGDETYLPVMAKNDVTEDRRFIPSPLTVVLSNLRSVVDSLQDVRTPREVRDAFILNNPIPGCRFAGRLLTNADEIIPPDYSSADLFRDIADVTNVLHFVEKHIPKLVGGQIDYDAPGTIAMLLSNDMGDLRCPSMTGTSEEYVKNCRPVGDIKEFWTTHHLDPSSVCHGVIGLLGETPHSLRTCYPLYLRRLSEASQRRHMISYSGVMATALAM